MDYRGIKKIIFRKKGFVLVEMLIVLGVIALFAGIIMMNYSGQNQRLRLKKIAQEAVSDLRQVQNFSVSTKINETDIPNGGYGIKFDKSANSYIIFSDANAAPNRVFDAGEEIETKLLDSDLEIYDINVSFSGSVSALNIVFVPPDPITYLNASSAFDLYATITFRVKGQVCPRFCRTITVKTSGIVE